MNSYKPPSLLLTALETRALYELAAFSWSFPLWNMAPTGDGHPVMILPGFMASDYSTIPLRLFLRSRGYEAYGWNMGRNYGRGIDIIKGIPDNAKILNRLRAIKQKHRQNVTLIGWSLGGIYAREIAKILPDAVRMVITMGSPFNGDPKANHMVTLFERMSGRFIEEMSPSLIRRVHQPPPVPSTSIFSRTDGIADWQCCVEHIDDDETENISVMSSHSGLGHNPLTLWIIADRLSQPEGEWSPFDNRGLRGILFGDDNSPALGFI